MSTNLAEASIDRRAFVAQLLAACPRALVVSGLGSASYDVFAAGDRPENFFTAHVPWTSPFFPTLPNLLPNPNYAAEVQAIKKG